MKCFFCRTYIISLIIYLTISIRLLPNYSLVNIDPYLFLGARGRMKTSPAQRYIRDKRTGQPTVCGKFQE